MLHTYQVERLTDSPSAMGHRDRMGHVTVWEETVKAKNALAALRAADKPNAVERTWPVEAIDATGEYAQAIDPTQAVEIDHASELISVGIICDRDAPLHGLCGCGIEKL